MYQRLIAILLVLAPSLAPAEPRRFDLDAYTPAAVSTGRATRIRLVAGFTRDGQPVECRRIERVEWTVPREGKLLGVRDGGLVAVVHFKAQGIFPVSARVRGGNCRGLRGRTWVHVNKTAPVPRRPPCVEVVPGICGPCRRCRR